VTVPLRLTHEALGHLVGAQRPTVTLALKDLRDRRLVTRLGRDGWLLAERGRTLLESEIDVVRYSVG
jgi:Mn-dependent DtxR family transcriptional regulator